MIVKIDHVALSADPAEGRDLLERLGYSPHLEEAGLRTEPIKEGLLEGRYDRHRLALYASPGGLGMELLSHVCASGAAGFILPIVENPPRDLFEFSPAGIEAGGMALELGRSRVPGAGVLGRFSDPSAVGVHDLWLDLPFHEDAPRFWGCLGFKPSEPESGFPAFVFRSPLSARACRLYYGGGLFSDRRGARPKLDNPGFNCLALVSSSPDQERGLLEAAGFSPTASARLSVGGKRLEVCFVEGPSGELVEIVGLIR